MTENNNKTIDIRLSLERKNIIRLENVISSNHKIKWRCKKDGFTWLAAPKDIFDKRKKNVCQRCGKNERETTESVKIKLLRRKIKLLNSYKNRHTKMLLKCNACDYAWEAFGSNVFNTKNPTGCPSCNGSPTTSKLSNKIIDTRVKNRGIRRIGNYKNNSTPLKWKCRKKGHIWFAVSSSVINNESGCPSCKESNESRLCDLLKNIAKYFRIQRRRKVIINNKIRFIDLFISNRTTELYIERHGQQHYYPVKIFGGAKQFKKQTKRDREVRNFFKNKKINYLEIPYWYKKEDIVTTLRKVIKNIKDKKIVFEIHNKNNFMLLDNVNQ